MTYFVKWTGSEKFDFRGVESFSLYGEALAFAKSLEKKGFPTCIYTGETMPAVFQATDKVKPDVHDDDPLAVILNIFNQSVGKK